MKKNKGNSILLVIIIILLISLGIFYFSPKQKINRSINSGDYLSTDDLYKICTESSCPTKILNISASIVSDNSGNPYLASIENGLAKHSVILRPESQMTVLDKYNLINRDGYFLGNGILNVKVKGEIEYEPSFPSGYISIYFNPSNIEIVSEGGCRTNGYPYGGGKDDCFRKINYNIDSNNAYNKLIGSKLYKEASISWLNTVKENIIEDTPKEYILNEEMYLREMFYDVKTNKWIFEVDSSDILYPGCCHDTFEVDSSNIFYKRTCGMNGACSDYAGYGFSKEE